MRFGTNAVARFKTQSILKSTFLQKVFGVASISVSDSIRCAKQVKPEKHALQGLRDRLLQKPEAEKEAEKEVPVIEINSQSPPAKLSRSPGGLDSEVAQPPRGLHPASEEKQPKMAKDSQDEDLDQVLDSVFDGGSEPEAAEQGAKMSDDPTEVENSSFDALMATPPPFV